MIQLQPVTKENLDEVLCLRINEDQAGFVSTTAESLAQAYVYRETAFPFAVYSDQEVVGFIMMGFYEAKNYYTLWKLLIDRDHQHKGCGRKALEMLRKNCMNPWDSGKPAFLKTACWKCGSATENSTLPFRPHVGDE